jgi:hypothetical protein
LTMLDPKGPMATELVRQIVTVHDLKDTPAISSAGFINWGGEPYVSGWHTWKQGVKSWEIMPAVRTPLPGTALQSSVKPGLPIKAGSRELFRPWKRCSSRT